MLSAFLSLVGFIILITFVVNILHEESDKEYDEYRKEIKDDKWPA